VKPVSKKSSPQRHKEHEAEKTALRAKRNKFLLRVLCVFVVNPTFQPATAADHVVSLNLCTDQMLVLLAPEKIAALSPLARDPELSYVAQAATHFPTVRASAEAVIRLHPDLILAAPYGAQTTVSLLQQEGLTVLRIDLPHDFAGIRAQTRRLAQTLGVPQRGEAIIAAMDAQLANLPHTTRPERALAWEPRGFTAEPGSLMDAVLQAAGYANAATGQRGGVETLLRHPPDLLVVPATPEFPSLATTMLDHPAIAGIPRRAIPPALTLCAGPFTAQAAELLAR
jgi:iron complex transport system substrate-binding protein